MHLKKRTCLKERALRSEQSKRKKKVRDGGRNQLIAEKGQRASTQSDCARDSRDGAEAKRSRRQRASGRGDTKKEPRVHTLDFCKHIESRSMSIYHIPQRLQLLLSPRQLQLHPLRLHSCPYHLRLFHLSCCRHCCSWPSLTSLWSYSQSGPQKLLLSTLYGNLSCTDPQKAINYRRYLGREPAEHGVQCGQFDSRSGTEKCREGADKDRGIVSMSVEVVVLV